MNSWRLPARVPLRLRFFFRGAFLLLALAILGLALSVLQDEKARAQRGYAEALKKTAAQIAARLRHPTGQLALLNPRAADQAAQPVHPLLLPFAALDFDDRNKVRQAVEMAGCGLQYPDGSTFCAAVGANPYAGGFVYLAASFAAGPAVAHASGDLQLTGVHRALVDVDYRGTRTRWTAPYERSADGRGRLTAYLGDAPLAKGVRPVRDFRGWLWQEGSCVDPAAAAPQCARRTFVSVRLPVSVFQQALLRGAPAWPPPDLDQLTVRLRLLAPDAAPPAFDSDTPGANLPFSLGELRALLRPGERLSVHSAARPAPLIALEGQDTGGETIAPWIARLIQALPAPPLGQGLHESAIVDTAQGRFTIALDGDLRTTQRTLAAVATRLAWTVGAMLLASALVWAALEWLVIRRVLLLSARAAAVSSNVRSTQRGAGLVELDLSDLGGRDELGVLAQGLQDLLHQVKEDVQREQIRAAQEKDLWHAVGHEIMAPLQSLMALHSNADDPSARYIARMQQAVRVLYGQASPSEAFEATQLALLPLDLDAFLALVADNAVYIGIADVKYPRHGQPLYVRADEFCLEDVVTHLLRNAQRHRTPGTPIRLLLEVDAQTARLTVHNVGAAVPQELLERIFEYGVSGSRGTPAAADNDAGTVHGDRRGQGLFVARTYMAKMRGTIDVRNQDEGVAFTLALPRIAP